MEIEAPGILKMKSYVDITIQSETFRVAAGFDKGKVKKISEEKELFSLNLFVSKRFHTSGVLQ
jgi:hypothetical protein